MYVYVCFVYTCIHACIIFIASKSTVDVHTYNIMIIVISFVSYAGGTHNDTMLYFNDVRGLTLHTVYCMQVC